MNEEKELEFEFEVEIFENSVGLNFQMQSSRKLDEFFVGMKNSSWLLMSKLLDDSSLAHERGENSLISGSSYSESLNELFTRGEGVGRSTGVIGAPQKFRRGCWKLNLSGFSTE